MQLGTHTDSSRGCTENICSTCPSFRDSQLGKFWKVGSEDEERFRKWSGKEAWIRTHCRIQAAYKKATASSPAHIHSGLPRIQPPNCRKSKTRKSFPSHPVKNRSLQRTARPHMMSRPHSYTTLPLPSPLASWCSENTRHVLPFRAWALAANITQPTPPPPLLSSLHDCHFLSETCPDHAI